jgi:hypothetical protein
MVPALMVGEETQGCPWFPWLVAGSLVGIHALTRFCTPPTNRAETSHGRYWFWAGAYAMGIMAAWAVLSSLLTRDALVRVFGLPDSLSGLGDCLSPPLFCALLITVLSSRVPWLQRGTGWFRERCYRWAAIPVAVRRLAAALRLSSYSVPTQNDRETIRGQMESAGFGSAVAVFSDHHSLEYVWTKAFALTYYLAQWESEEERFARLAGDHAELHGKIKAEQEALLESARELFGAPAVQSDEARNAHAGWRTDFRRRCERFIDLVCEFIARGALYCYRNHDEQRRRLAAMGFFQQTGEDKVCLSVMEPVNRVAQLFIGLTGLFVACFLLQAHLVPDSAPGGQALHLPIVHALRVAMTICVAVFLAIALKYRWPLAQQREAGNRPWLSYLLTGGAAGVLGIGIGLLGYRMVLGNWAVAWRDYWTAGWPWQLLTIGTAMATAFNLDNCPERLRPALGRHLQWVEGLGQGLLTGALALIPCLLTNLGAERLYLSLALALLVGGVIGYRVPVWYRRSREQYKQRSDLDAALGLVPEE